MRRQFLLVEALENDDVVHAIQEFRPEMPFQLGHAPCPFPRRLSAICLVRVSRLRMKYS